MMFDEPNRKFGSDGGGDVDAAIACLRVGPRPIFVFAVCGVFGSGRNDFGR